MHPWWEKSRCYVTNNLESQGYLRYPEWNKAKSAGDSVKACSLYQHGKCVVDYVKNFDSSHCDCIPACSERIPESQYTQYGYDSYIETRSQDFV